jgi:AmiR/NasT family two-component response regulator
MQSRSDIDVAKGILVERHGVGPQQAFDMLVAYSQKHHVKVVDVARAIVAAAAGGHDDRAVGEF